MVLQVHVEAVVPIFLGDVIDLVTVVVGGIVDQHVERTVLFDKVADERCPFAFKDRYYFSTNEVPDPKFVKLKNYDILWQVGFTKPLPVLGEINSKVDEMYPMITPSGKELYFSRKTAEGWVRHVPSGSATAADRTGHAHPRLGQPLPRP